MAHAWRQGDLLMLDNSLLRHGRNPESDLEEPQIWILSGYAGFLEADDPGLADP